MISFEFFQRDDVESIRGEFSGPISTENFVSSLSNHDLILSNQTDDNPITSICGEAQVFYRRPESDGHSSSVPDGIYLCRYSIAFGANTSEGKVEVTPFTGDNDEWSDILAATLEPQAVQKTEERQRPSSKKSASSLGSTEDFRSTSTCSTEDSDSIALAIRTGGLDEGTTEQRDIRVGREHQAIVPAFVPNQEVVSRNPTLVWTPNKISQEEMDQFLEQAAQILTPYLRDNKLTHEEPYSPLPPDDMEEMVRARVGEVLPTLCSICTASSLSKKSNNMLRECDGDSILALLHEKGYDVQAALAAIEASPLNFLTAWSLQEKELFNSGFRRFSGSLRTICKGITPSKDFHDVIDYHYRFKIPDQFRRFQEKKREMAVRMLECIETRRNIHTVIQVDYERSVTAEAVAKKRSKESEW